MDEARKIEGVRESREEVREGGVVMDERRLRPKPPERDSSGGYEIKPPKPVPGFSS
jgi:hypothetical protein